MVDFNGGLIQLHTRPMPPLPIEMVEYTQIRGVGSEMARLFFESYGRVVKVENGLTTGEVDGVEYKLYHTDVEFDDTLEIAVRNEQIARKLINWVQWYYSLISSQNLLKSSTPVDEFFQKYVVLDLNVNLVELGPFFRKTSPVIRGGKLKLPSQVVLNKLSTYLKLQIVRRPAYIQSYYKKTTLEDYYRTLTDFRGNYNYVITNTRETPTTIPLVPQSKILESELPVATIIGTPESGNEVVIVT